MDKAFAESDLPNKVDKEFFMKLLIEIREKSYIK